MQIKCTKNYSMFENHENNRNLHHDPVLMESMKTHGFIPALPLWVSRISAGKLKVITGHHRLHAAMALKLPVYYVEYTLPDVNLFSIEGTHQQWTLEDFCYARKTDGHEFSSAILDMKNRSGLPIGVCVSALKGHTTASNAVPDIKQGKDVEVRTDIALKVEKFVDAVKPFVGAKATRSTFAMCVLMCIISEMVDMEKLKNRIMANPQKVGAFSNRDECLKILEDVYNFRSRVPESIASNVKTAISHRNAIKQG